MSRTKKPTARLSKTLQAPLGLPAPDPQELANEVRRLRKLLRQVANAKPDERKRLLAPWRTKKAAGAPRRHSPEGDRDLLRIIETVRADHGFRSDRAAIEHLYDTALKNRGNRPTDEGRGAEVKTVSNIIGRARRAAGTPLKRKIKPPRPKEQ